jgi:hypothetical protein
MLIRSIGSSVPHRKPITSPLRAQQVNAIYRFVTMVHYYNYHNSDIINRPVFYFKYVINETVHACRVKAPHVWKYNV